MNLSEWAEAQHIHPQTAYRWFRDGRLPVPAQRVGGLIVVGDLTKCASAPPSIRVGFLTGGPAARNHGRGHEPTETTEAT